MLHSEIMTTDAQIVHCYSLMRLLRPSLLDSADFLDKVRQQQAQGYQLLALLTADTVVALAGYRYQQNLVHGRFVYVDDLVTDSGRRGQQLGSQLLSAVMQEARLQACDHMILDSGLTNVLAHRFYYRQGLLAQALHFSLALR